MSEINVTPEDWESIRKLIEHVSTCDECQQDPKLTPHLKRLGDMLSVRHRQQREKRQG
jgi:hypothetical protein